MIIREPLPGREYVPEGHRRVEGVEVVLNGQVYTEVWTSENAIIICGDPESDDERHDCDQMGCGWSHVIAIIRDVRPAE
jgi:hypothetical protein